jgi:hypothetical protein
LEIRRHFSGRWRVPQALVRSGAIRHKPAAEVFDAPEISFSRRAMARIRRRIMGGLNFFSPGPCR